jgi:ACS family tartrate transporter-like MFS transporter
LISTPRDVASPSASSAPEAFARATLAKVAWRLLPFLLLLYIVAWIDRVNIGFAARQMNVDLGLSDKVYGFGAGVFFIGYALCEVPSNLILARVGARRWIARIMITWGILSIAMLYARGPVSFASLRFMLGVAEAGFLPGIIYYLGQWFPSAERARAVSWFMLGIPLSTVVGGPLAGVILGLDGWHGLEGWQWLFLLEGIPAILLGVTVLFYLTDTPEQAHWLAPAQRDWLSTKMRAESAAAAKRHGLDLKAAMLHPTVWVLCVILFACQCCSYGLTLWIPQIVNGLAGLTDIEIGLVSAIPYVAATVGMIAIGWSSDRTGERLMHVAIPSLVAAIAFGASALVSSPVPSMLALSLAAVGDIGTRGPFWALPTRFLAGTAAAGGIALINTMASLGGFVGPYAVGWVRQTTHSFSGGLIFLGSVMLVGAIATLFLRNAPVLAEK